MLTQKTRDVKKLARFKIKKEMQGCTFKPTLDKKSKYIGRSSRANSDSGLETLYSSLHKQHKEKLAKYESLKI